MQMKLRHLMDHLCETIVGNQGFYLLKERPFSIVWPRVITAMKV